MKAAAYILVATLTLSASAVLAHPDHDFDPKLLKKGPVVPVDKAYGRQANASQATRTINLDLSDKMRFTPAEVTIRQNETIRFLVKNSAKVPQEMVLGTAGELKERAALVKKFPKMSMNQPNQVLVGPGQSGELVWQFPAVGKFSFACGAPACVDAGAMGKIVVSAP